VIWTRKAPSSSVPGGLRSSGRSVNGVGALIAHYGIVDLTFFQMFPVRSQLLLRSGSEMVGDEGGSKRQKR
jgi:hypothetical protein